jgi:hypothetical protein
LALTCGNGSTADPLGGTAKITPISGDVVTLSGTGTGSFAKANVGTAKNGVKGGEIP